MYSQPIENLIKSFTKLPSVGRRTAERFVFFLLKSGKKNVADLSLNLKELVENIKSCETCWDFSDSNPCPICSNQARNKSMICVVSEPQGVQVIEKTHQYKGYYHVLRGVIRADDIEAAKFLKVHQLLERVKNPQVKEIILALNPDMEGETTMMFLEKKLGQANQNIKITRLVRGLPMGSDLHYTDEITLTSALQNRVENKKASGAGLEEE